MKRRQLVAALAVAFLTGTAAPTWAQDPPAINAATEAAFGRLAAAPAVKQALDFIKAEDERTLKDQIELTEIPAPPFKESVRAAEFLKRFKALGLADARIDAEGNVIAVRKGTGRGPVLVV